jgi:hypothetical protein
MHMSATASIGVDLEIGSQKVPEKLNVLAPGGVFVDSEYWGNALQAPYKTYC